MLFPDRWFYIIRKKNRHLCCDCFKVFFPGTLCYTAFKGVSIYFKTRLINYYIVLDNGIMELLPSGAKAFPWPCHQVTKHTQVL